MNRREWLKKALAIAATGIAANELELLEKLGHTKIFSSVPLQPYYIECTTFSMGFITTEMVEDDWYTQYAGLHKQALTLRDYHNDLIGDSPL